MGDELKEQVRNPKTEENCFLLLTKTKPVRPSTKSQAHLNLNKNIIITHTNIGKAKMVMNTTDYMEKMGSILQENTFKLAKRYPTTYLKTNIN